MYKIFSFQNPGACIYEPTNLFPEYIECITTSNTTFSLTRLTVPTIEKLINNIQTFSSLRSRSFTTSFPSHANYHKQINFNVLFIVTLFRWKLILACTLFTANVMIGNFSFNLTVTLNTTPLRSSWRYFTEWVLVACTQTIQSSTQGLAIHQS